MSAGNCTPCGGDGFKPGGFPPMFTHTGRCRRCLGGGHTPVAAWRRLLWWLGILQ